MTIDALRGKSGRSRRRAQRADLPIGEVDADIFNCPACARPLGVGTAKCPGCSTRLISGIRATKVLGFVAVGLVAGLMIGAGSMAVVFAVSSAAPAVLDEEVAVVAPSAVPVDEGPAPVANPAIPPAAISALRQSALIDQRLTADGAALAASLSARSPSTAEIARSLRALAANAAFGDRIAPVIGSWPAGSALSGGLVELYADVGRTAREGLSASLNNRAAYVAAGRAMLTVLADLPNLDATARALAGSIDLDLVPLDPASAP